MFFEAIDNAVIEFVHTLCERFGSVLTPFMRLISILGEKCWIFLSIAFIMLFRKKTRWIGATAIFAVFIGFIIADLAIKPFFMRVRPYLTSNIFQDYWILAGSYPETGYSMPSGHTLGVTAFFVSLFITSPKQNRALIKRLGIICVILMAFSRCYFMHHYFTDCVVGAIIGVIVSYVSKVVMKGIHYILKLYEDITFFNFILNFDIFGNR